MNGIRLERLALEIGIFWGHSRIQNLESERHSGKRMKAVSAQVPLPSQGFPDPPFPSTPAFETIQTRAQIKKIKTKGKYTYQPVLAARIRQPGGRTAQTGLRADIHNHAMLLLLHERQHLAHHLRRCSQVHGNHFVPLGVGDGVRGAEVVCDACDVGEDVDVRAAGV
jgi:hypothetical protein